MTAYRSIAERSCPPYCLGQVIPSQPRSPSLREKAGSTPESHVSTCVSKVPAASSAARNSRTSARTCSAASDRGAGARVNELLMRLPTSVWWLPAWLYRSAAAPGRPAEAVPLRDDAGFGAEVSRSAVAVGGRGRRPTTGRG